MDEERWIRMAMMIMMMMMMMMMKMMMMIYNDIKESYNGGMVYHKTKIAREKTHRMMMVMVMMMMAMMTIILR